MRIEPIPYIADHLPSLSDYEPHFTYQYTVEEFDGDTVITIALHSPTHPLVSAVVPLATLPLFKIHPTVTPSQTYHFQDLDTPLSGRQIIDICEEGFHEFSKNVTTTLDILHDPDLNINML